MQGSISQSYFIYDQTDFVAARDIYFNFKIDEEDFESREFTEFDQGEAASGLLGGGFNKFGGGFN
jgi:hypothetical protein